jgi:hypothetical protein
MNLNPHVVITLQRRILPAFQIVIAPLFINRESDDQAFLSIYKDDHQVGDRKALVFTIWILF